MIGQVLLAGPVADSLLAHQPLLVAVPFVLPAVLVVAAVVGVVLRDRREAASVAQAEEPVAGAPSRDGTPPAAPAPVDRATSSG